MYISLEVTEPGRGTRRHMPSPPLLSPRILIKMSPHFVEYKNKPDILARDSRFSDNMGFGPPSITL